MQLSLPCPRSRRHAGFTLIELMIVVAIIGLLAAIAIPTFMRFQLKAKTSEVKSNLVSIHTAEEAYFSEYGRYVAAAAEPSSTPDTGKAVFAANTGFQAIGFAPEGRVHFSYAVAVTAQDSGYTTDALADIDGNGSTQSWVFAKEANDGSRVTGALGCDVSALVVEVVVPCTADSGQSIF
jgi:type IV pilus assembly protein PilA